MDYFKYVDNQYYGEELSLSEIAAKVGTPCYVYSRATIERQWRVFDSAFDSYPHRVCYSVKANSNLAVLDVLTRLGSGFDIVSAGELHRVMRAGGDAGKIVFSGVGKSDTELCHALKAGVGCLNIESESELHRIQAVAQELRVKAPISIRVNPDVDANTHPYIATGLRDSKFGLGARDAERVFVLAAAMPNIEIKGIACHIGSQLTETRPFIDSLEKLIDFIGQLARVGIGLSHIDIGGGLGIIYHNESPPTPDQYANALINVLKRRKCNLPIIIQPGRAIVGNAGVLLTRVEYLKMSSDRNFAVVDAGMNDLLRPALYQGFHEILPVRLSGSSTRHAYDIVGPVCESADYLGKGRVLDIGEGDLLVVRSVGAYGFSMSSEYNSRLRLAEVMIDRDKYYVIRKRQTVDQSMENESLLPR
ncbi:MAG: diaminopimelate decarboxylase [Acidiferrobacteraceae bacterium]|nr:diaminopimelate decarboxylase [Acidiferrobacteraceae bacterium]